MSKLAIQLKLEAGFDRRVRFMSVALAESRGVVPTMAKLRLKELPLTKGTLFAGEWTPTVESTTKAQLLSVTQAQLARDLPGAGKSSGDRFRIPFKKGKGYGGGQAKKAKKGGGYSSSSSHAGDGNQKGAGRGRAEAGVAVLRRKTLKPHITPPSPKLNDQPCLVGEWLRSFAHLWPLVISDKFILEMGTRGYRIEFMGNPLTTSMVWWTDTPKNPAWRADLEKGLQSMPDKRAVVEIPVSPDTPGFYSLIFLVAKELEANSQSQGI